LEHKAITHKAPMPISSQSVPKAASPLGEMGSKLATAPAAPLIETKQEHPVVVYYVNVKNGVMEIVAKVGNRFVTMKAKVNEVFGAQIEKLKEYAITAHGVYDAYAEKAKAAVKAKTIIVQDGYIYVTGKVNGSVVQIKGKMCEMGDAAQKKLADSKKKVGQYTEPVIANAIAVYDKSKAKAGAALEPFVQTIKPYYMKVHNGVASIVATVGDKVVIVRLRVSEVYGSVQVQAMQSLTAARATVDKFASPVMTRFVSLKDGVYTRAEQISIRVNGGIVSVRTQVGDRFMEVHTALANIFGTISMKASDGLAGVKKAMTDLTTKLVEVTSKIQGQAFDKVKVIYMKCEEGMLHVKARVGDRTVDLRARISDILQYIQAQQNALYTTGRAAIVDAYGGAKVKVFKVADAIKTKSIEVGSNVRVVVADPKAQVTAASAATGAVAMGAGGGAMGLMTGAGCGVVLAPFTFGLSIPLGAGAGLCIGTAGGATAGLVTGGAAGYGVHKHKDGISNGMSGAVSKVKHYKDIAAASTRNMTGKLMGHTGGTAGAAES